MRKVIPILALIVLLLSQTMAQLADSPWPMRGGDAQRTGRSKYVGFDQPFVKWVDYNSHRFDSSPVIGADDTMYCGCELMNIHGYNPDTGIDDYFWGSYTNTQVVSGPAIAKDGTIYVGVDVLYALTDHLLSVKWMFKTKGEVNSSPLVGPDGTIYVGCDDKSFYAVKPDGTQKWAAVTGGKIASSPALSSDGSVIYVGSQDNKVYAYNTSDGSEKWSYTTGGMVNSIPAVGSDGTIYVGSRDKNIYALNPTDGKVKWQFATGAEVDSSACIGSDGTIYIGSSDKKLYALKSDGSKKWEFLTGGPIINSVAVDADSNVYVYSTDGVVNSIKADGTSRWIFKVQILTNSCPAIAKDGTIYVGNIAIGKSNATISLTSPNGGEQWMPGSLHNITWKAGFTGNVKIELLKGGIVNTVIANSTSNSGSYKWTISPTQIAGGDYKVRVSNIVNPTVNASSQNNFYIGRGGAVAQNSLILTSPMGGQNWQQGSTHAISWKSFGTPGDLKIELFKAGVLESTISANAVNNGTYSWTIPTTQTLGTDYRVKITALGDATITSQSTTNFTISAMPTLTVTAPNGGEQWMQGSNHSIVWTSTGTPGNVKIELINNYTVDSIIADNIPDAGSYNWLIPIDKTPGTTYKVRISPVTNPNIMDESDADFAITQILGIPVLLSPANNATKVTAPVTIAWQPVNNAVSYEYQLFGSTSVVTPVETKVVNTTSALIQYNLAAGAMYSWRVRAIDNNGLQSGYSQRWIFVMQTIPSIGTPVLTFPADNAINVVTTPGLTWQAANNATVYSVEVADDAAFTNPIVNVSDVTTTSYDVTNLANATKYYWRVKGGDGTRWGNAATSSFTTLAILKQRISAPSLASPLNGAKDVAISTTLSWNAVDTAVNYTMQYATNNSFVNAVEVTGGNLTTDVTLLPNTRYFYRAKADDGAGNTSNWSSVWYFTTIAQVVQLDAPTLITPTDAAVDVPINTTFTWSAVTGAVSYDFEISTDSTFAKSSVLTAAGTTISSTLVNNSVYYWRVRGKQGTTVGPWSTVSSFTTVALVVTNGVDSAIANSKTGYLLSGVGIINNTGDLQTIVVDQPINRQSEFLIMVKNTGNVPDSFFITSTSTIQPKWKISVFDISGIDRSKKVFTDGWVSYPVKPGESVKLVVRFAASSGQKIDASNPPTQSINIVATSWKDLSSGSATPASDTVTAVVVLTKSLKL